MQQAPEHHDKQEFHHARTSMGAAAHWDKCSRTDT
jgi:hypothetical protein